MTGGGAATGVNDALMLAAALTVSEHAAVPEQDPAHCAKEKPVAGLAFSCKTVPD